MTEQSEDIRNDFLLEVRDAVKRNQVVLIIMHNDETDEFSVWNNADGCNFDDILSCFCEMPFLGRIKPEDAFEEWEEYIDDVALTEIFGFKLEDGQVQIAILDYFLLPPEEAN